MWCGPKLTPSYGVAVAITCALALPVILQTIV
jgi:hypothetical protein